jgi:tRNA-specific 2-thiouridylase
LLFKIITFEESKTKIVIWKGEVMRVAVAMSGGVDSAVAAFLLKKRGYEIVGVHFKTEPDVFFSRYKLTHKVCCSPDDTSDVKKIAKKLGVELQIIDVHKEFEKEIIMDFIEGYRQGLTPNPCVKCNRKIKFLYLLKFAQRVNASLWATGHHARIKDGRILVANDAKKDQSYFLALVQKEVLKGLLLPIGEYQKEDVRKIAEENDLIVSSKPDSQDVCFIPDGDMKSFFEEHNIPLKRGLVLDTNGNVVGEHNGYQLYTIGQRKGIGVAMGERVYVVDIIPSKNVIVVGKKEELYKKSVEVVEMNLQMDQSNEIDCECKVRSTAKKVPCHVKFGKDGKRSDVEFSQPVLPVPGQLLALYDGEYLLGGGIIAKSDH